MLIWFQKSDTVKYYDFIITLKCVDKYVISHNLDYFIESAKICHCLESWAKIIIIVNRKDEMGYVIITNWIAIAHESGNRTNPFTVSLSNKWFDIINVTI